MTFSKLKTLGLVILASLTLVACGQKSSTNQVEKIQDNGKLIVALSPEFAPFEFRTLVDGKSEIVGSDIELAKAIADELGVELELSAMNFNNVLSSIQTGKADLAISGISATEERAKVYDFSEPYYTTKNVIITQNAVSSDYQTTDDLAGKSLAVQKGSVQEILVKELFPEANIISLATIGNMINELIAGSVDAVILEEPTAKGYTNNNASLAITAIDIVSDSDDSYAIALKKGSSELKEVVDKVVTELVESGQYKQFVDDAFELSQNAE